MLIAIVGPPKAGKNLLAQHLTTEHSFTRVRLGSSTSGGKDALHFVSSSEFLDHATRTWRCNYVTTDLISKLKLQEFAKRPFVAVVAVDAPMGVRFIRAQKDAAQQGFPAPSLERFVAADDLTLHGPLPTSLFIEQPIANGSIPEAGRPLTPPPTHLAPNSNGPPSPSPSPARTPPASLAHDPIRDLEPLSTILPLATVVLTNAFDTPEPFFSSLSLQVLANSLRPPWDTYFMLLASLASLRSNCMKRRVGAVLVREKRVVSTGYNGTPRGVKNCGEGGCGRCNSGGDGLGGEGATNGVVRAMGEGLDECLCLHAEENALLEAGRERVSGGGTEGAVLYCNTCPCLRCTVKIVQCGVREVVYSLSYSMDTASRRVMEEAGIVLRQMDPPSLTL